MNSLFDPIQVGELALANRIVMAPLTRNRAGEGRVPRDLHVEYYRQRAGAGLIVTEASQVGVMGQGYLDTPGIHTPQQVAAWSRVTAAVHAAGGRIVIQLWHVGRISHVSLLPDGASPVSSTSRGASSKTFTKDGFVPVSPPVALRDDEIALVVGEYRHAARCAMEAGFDGVEIHSANNYLLEQFLRDSVNDRKGPYGGGVIGRTRLLFEVVDAVAGVAGPGRTGIRLSPMTSGNGTPRDSDPQSLYSFVVDGLAARGLCYVHVIEGETGGLRLPADADRPFDYEALRRRFPGRWIVNNGYSRAQAIEAVETGRADLVAFGRPFIANPDLPRRLREDLPLAEVNWSTVYGGGAAGYTDYPAWS